jgi:hypothetical protein
MYGQLSQLNIQIITQKHEELLKEVQRERMIDEAIAGRKPVAQPHHNRLGDLLARLSFRNQTALAEAIS